MDFFLIVLGILSIISAFQGLAYIDRLNDIAKNPPNYQVTVYRIDPNVPPANPNQPYYNPNDPRP